MKYDEKTGLPELPTNLFWRLEKDSTEHPCLRIMGRKQKRFLFWTWTHTYQTQWRTWVFDGLKKTNMQRAAERLIEKRRLFLDNNEDLYGDYPPKTLLDTKGLIER